MNAKQQLQVQIHGVDMMYNKYAKLNAKTSKIVDFHSSIRRITIDSILVDQFEICPEHGLVA